MRSALRSAARRAGVVLAHRRLPLLLAVISPLLLLPALGTGFQLDDHFQRPRLLGHGAPAIQLFVFYDGDPAVIRAGMDEGWLPWWCAENLRHANLRYLSVLTMQLDYLLWPDRPALMHLHSLLWLGALVAAAALLYRRILGASWVAGLAALLYAVDDAHALPATYLANRNALVATCLGILCLLCFARWREQGWRPGAVLAPAFLGLALTAGEMALATAGYLVAYTLFLERGPASGRIKGLLPSGGVLLLWAVLYKTVGFGAEGSGFYRDPLSDPLAFAAGFLERGPVLLLGQWTPVPADLGSSVAAGSGGAATLLHLAGLATLLLLVFLLTPLLRRDRVARFWCLGAALALLPVAAVGPQNRLLFFVGLGSMGLLACLAQGLFSGTPPLPAAGWWRIPARGAAIVLLAVHLLLAPALGLLTVETHRSASKTMERAIASVPADPRIGEQDLVVVNPADYVYLVSAIPIVKGLRGEPRPRRLRALAHGTSGMEITRVGERTLEVRLPEGLFPDPFSRYFRGEQLPFTEGDKVELTGFSVEVLDADEDGSPRRLRFRFAVPLEDPSLRWLRWNGRAYVEWPAPDVGESVWLPPAAGIFTGAG